MQTVFQAMANVYARVVSRANTALTASVVTMEACVLNVHPVQAQPGAVMVYSVMVRVNVSRDEQESFVQNVFPDSTANIVKSVLIVVAMDNVMTL